MRLILTLLVLVVLLAGPSLRGQQVCEIGDVLTLDNVVGLLRDKTSDLRIRQNVQACGVTFVADDAAVRQLTTAGASSALVRLVAPPASPPPGETWTPLTDRRAMVRIGTGSFLMGSPDSEPGRKRDEAQYSVTVEGFWLDTKEVTNEDYQRFVLARPAWGQGGASAATMADKSYLLHWKGADFPPGDGLKPVTYVSWHAARAYAQWAGKRLATEAEWEYAARAGSPSAYWWGSEFSGSRANNGPDLWPVGREPARNNWNLFDMLGNVSEWTSSLYRDYPYRRDDRESPETRGDRVHRGGGFSSNPTFLRSANRMKVPPETVADNVGFRCAR